MKRWKTDLLALIAVLAAAATPAADVGNRPVSFENETDLDIVEEGDNYWFSQDNLTPGECGTRVKYADTSETPATSRSAAFDEESQAYYFAVNSGMSVIYRTVLPTGTVTVSDEEKPVMQGLAIDTDAIYLDAQVKFVASPSPVELGADKLLLWLNSDSKLCVTAGKVAKSLGASGMEAHHYVTTNSVVPGTWHRVVFKCYRALDIVSNSSFEIFVDGSALTLPEGESVVVPELRPVFESYLNNDAQAAYYRGQLFPSLMADSRARMLYAFGMSGDGGGVDDLVISNGVPNAIAKPAVRHLVVSCEPGLEGFTYQVKDGSVTGDAVPVSGLGGKRADVAIPVPARSSGEATQVFVSSPVFADGYKSLGLRWDSGSEGSVTPATTNFNISAGFDTVRGTIEVSSDPDFSACRLYGYSAVGDDAGEWDFADLSNAVVKAKELLDDSTSGVASCRIKLLRSVEANLKLADVAVALDLNGYTLSGAYTFGDCIPVINVKDNVVLKIEDSDGNGAISAPESEAYAIENYGDTSQVKISGGSFENTVGPEIDSEFVEGRFALTGGRYYANAGEAGFTIDSRHIDDGYESVWVPSGQYWRVGKAGQSAAALQSVAMACATLGISAADAARMEESAAEPVITISDMSTTASDNGTVVVCYVKVVNAATGELMNVASISLSGIVQTSTDLVNWTHPSQIVYEDAPEPDGSYKVTITLPAGEDNFIRLSDE